MKTAPIIGAGALVLIAAGAWLLDRPRDTIAAGRPAAVPAGQARPNADAAETDTAPPAPVAPTAPAGEAVSAPGLSPDPELDRLRTENAALGAENERLKGHLNDLLNWVLANFRGRYPVPEALMAHLALPTTREDFTVDPDVAEFLRMQPAEVDRVNEAFRYARALVDLAEQRAMSVELLSADVAQVRVPAYPEAGDAIRSWLYTALDETLGVDRSDRFITASENNFDQRFGYFGTADRTIRFELAGTDENAMLRIRDEWRMADAEHPDRVRVIATEMLATNIPDPYVSFLSPLAGRKTPSP